MSKFCRMHIAFGKDVTESGGHFHNVTVDEDYDVYAVGSVVLALTNAGFDVMSVVVDGYDFIEEMWKHIKHSSSIQPFFEALASDIYSADIICAFILENNAADATEWTDTIYFHGEDHEAIAREWADIFHKVYEEVPVRFGETTYERVDVFPDWMEIDWEETAESIARDNQSSLVEFNGYYYYFG